MEILNISQYLFSIGIKSGTEYTEMAKMLPIGAFFSLANVPEKLDIKSSFFYLLFFLDDPETEPFWPALHCFLVILDRLGAKVWGQIEPLEAFRAITKAGSYMAEIENIRQKTSRYD